MPTESRENTRDGESEIKGKIVGEERKGGEETFRVIERAQERGREAKEIKKASSCESEIFREIAHEFVRETQRE